ncbi:transmembrane protein, putative, partial [Rhizoctonia solani AG-3 Rhs1AP]
MSTIQQPSAERPPTERSSTMYAGPALGRDDPVWTYYLEESSGRDSDLVDGWNKSMDVLLLFAALFSAIVTAFLNESYKNLQPDAALITAAGVSRMVDLAEAIASREPAPSSGPLPTIENFHPTKNDIVINTLWFLSLALSISVTLIAMLVKEWGDGYRRGDRFSPYYVQARTRQARYNGLKNWGAKQVVRILPITMHIALVSHSQAEKSKEAAIRAIANAIAGPEFWDHLIKDKLITLMAQHFISFFKGTLDQSEINCADEILNLEDQVSLCSQALAKIAKHSTMQLIQDAGPNSTTPERAVKESGRIMLPEAYFISVQNGLRSLTDSESLKLAASGFCGASAWYTSTGRTNRKQTPLLTKLVDYFEKYSRSCAKSSKIPDDLLVNLVEALSVETSYMTWELQDQQMNKVIESVIKLCLPKCSGEVSLLDGPARRAMSVELAVIAALINDYQTISDPEIDQLSTEGHDKYGIRSQYMKSHEAYKLRHPYPAGSYLTYSRQWRAVWTAELCVKNPKYLESHSDALLLLGLAGILRSFPMGPSLFGDVVKLFAAQLTQARKSHSGRMSLPFVLVSSCDIQSQVAQDILAAFYNQSSRSEGTVDQARIDLMGCFAEQGQWFEFQPVFLVEILKMLRLSHDERFQRQCVLALDNYWFMNSASGFDVYSLPRWELFIHHDLIRVLVNVFESIPLGSPEASKQTRSTISCFAKLARTIAIQTSSNTAHPVGTHSSGQNIQSGTIQSDPQAAAGQPNSQETTSEQATNPQSRQESDVSNQVNNTSPADYPQKLLRALESFPRDNKLFSLFDKDVNHKAKLDIHQDDFNFWYKAMQLLSNESQVSAAPSRKRWGFQAVLTIECSSQGSAMSIPTGPAVASGSQTTVTLGHPQASTSFVPELPASSQPTG